MDTAFWRRLAKAWREVFLPVSGVKAMVAQIVTWLGIVGATALAAMTWDQILPPSVKGKLLLLGLLLLVVVMGIQAAYRLLRRAERLEESERTLRDKQREKVMVEIFRMLSATMSLQKVLLGDQNLLTSGPSSEWRHALDSVLAGLEGYKSATRSLNFLESAQHSQLQAEMERWLRSDRNPRTVLLAVHPFLVEANRYCTIHARLGGYLDCQELEALADWLGLDRITPPLGLPASGRARQGEEA